ncbi:sensor histidine kinase [Streptosporangium roseum]|uniref:sensor histidine kinase n=1 Tax=Streptosporangium roseum TaxID=2001 RepID=UPI00331AAFF8
MSRFALMPTLVCLTLYCLFRISVLAAGMSFGSPPDLAVVVAGAVLVVVLGGLYLAVVLRRLPPWVPAVQVLLAFGPYAVFGDAWGPVSALPAAALPLALAGWAGWAGAGLVVVGELAVRLLWLPSGGLAYALWAALISAALGLGFFATARLGHLVRELEATRAEHASAEVARERLRIAGELRASLGTRLAAVIAAGRRAADDPARFPPAELVEGARQALDAVRSVADDYREHSLAAEAESAATVLAAAGVPATTVLSAADRLPAPVDAALAALLRRTVVAALRSGSPSGCRIELDAQARFTVVFTGLPSGALREAVTGTVITGTEVELAEEGERAEVVVRVSPPPGRVPARRPKPVATVPWLAWCVLLVLEIDHLGTAALRLFGARQLALSVPSPAELAVAAVALPAVAVLQLHHVLPRPPGVQPPAWRVTLAAQIGLVVLALTAAGDITPLPYLGMVAGVVLFHVRAPLSWGLAALLVCGVPVLLYGVEGVVGSPFTVLGGLPAAAMTYALCRLPVTAGQVRQAREELARVTVLKERLRIARDLHDLLGFQLSAVVVKGELADRLAGGAPGAARVHLTEAVALAEQALSSVRSVTGESAGPAFGQEVEAARAMLAAAGIEARVRLGAAPGEPAAIVLREAVTNAVRHARARVCEIETTPEAEGTVRLRVSNDGAPPPVAGRQGTGLLNLASRARQAGGHLSTERDGERFTLTAVLPTDASDPACLGGAPDGVQPVAHAPIGDR